MEETMSSADENFKSQIGDHKACRILATEESFYHLKRKNSEAVFIYSRGKWRQVCHPMGTGAGEEMCPCWRSFLMKGEDKHPGFLFTNFKNNILFVILLDL